MKTPQRCLIHASCQPADKELLKAVAKRQRRSASEIVRTGIRLVDAGVLEAADAALLDCGAQCEGIHLQGGQCCHDELRIALSKATAPTE